MMQYEWRVSLLEGKQSVRLSPQGIWIGETIFPWSSLRDVSFVRYQTRGGVNEDLSLFFAEDTKRTLRWTGSRHNRAAWRDMLVALAQMAERVRPDLDLRDGPDAQEQLLARWIGLGVAGVALTVMGGVFLGSETFVGYAFATWIGLVGGSIGVMIFRFYSRLDAPPRLDWASFAAREGQAGELPPN